MNDFLPARQVVKVVTCTPGLQADAGAVAEAQSDEGGERYGGIERNPFEFE